MAKVNVDKLSLEIINELQAYQNVTLDIMKYAVTRTAKETVKEIRKNAQEQFPDGGGDYAKSWAYKRDPTLKGKWRFSMVCYSRKPHYRLAHLLEKGHAKVNGGRVPGRPHISPAEEMARRNLEQYIIDGLVGEARGT